MTASVDLNARYNKMVEVAVDTLVHVHSVCADAILCCIYNEIHNKFNDTDLTFPCSHTIHYGSTDDQSRDKIAAFTAKNLQGEFCYVQTKDGKIAAIHFSPTDNHDGINVKRGIASTFQANFGHQMEVEESDPGSHHISHYK